MDDELDNEATALGADCKSASPDNGDHIDIEGFASIVSLIHFIAEHQDAEVETIEAMLCAEVAANSVRSIRQSQFERAVGFLADLEVKDRLH